MREFITRFPTSVLAQNAQHRIDVLERAARERQDKEQAKLEAAKQREIEKRLEERLARLEALSASDARIPPLPPLAGDLRGVVEAQSPPRRTSCSVRGTTGNKMAVSVV
jgi:hypothetical protein